jgi:4-amino-4-deoxy-L-arabinose transferase-like glycosyltransferase
MRIRQVKSIPHAGSVVKNRLWSDWWLWVVVLGALLFRVFIMLRSQFVVSFDEPHYLCLAASLISNGIRGLLHPYWTPFYPLCIALFNVFLHNLELAGRLVNILTGSLMVLLVYRISLMLFGRKEALLSAMAIAFAPAIAANSTNVMPETLYTMLGIGGIVVGWVALERKRWWLFGITGALWGAAYLTKPEGVGFLMVYLCILGIISIVSRKHHVRMSFVRNSAMVLVGFLLLASTYLIYLHQTIGRWTITTKGIVNQQMEAVVLLDIGGMKDPLFHLTEDNRVLPYDMAFHFGNFHELFKNEEGRQRIIYPNVFNYAEKFIKNFYHVERTSVPQLFTTVLFVICTLGLFSTLRDRKRASLTLYFLSFVVFFWFLIVPVFHVNERYLLVLLPLCLAWFGKGILILHSWIIALIKTIWGSMSSKQYFWISWAAVLTWILTFYFVPECAKVAVVRKYNKDMWVQPMELKEAGAWLKNRNVRPPVLMSINKAVDFYAGQYDMRKGASFSYDSVDRNLRYARFRGVDYVVFSSRYLGWFPNLKPLVEDANPCPGLERVYDKTDPVGIRTVIYRLLPEEQLSHF